MDTFDRIAELVEALAAGMRTRDQSDLADRMLDRLYCASTGNELVMGLRKELRLLDWRQMGQDLPLVFELEKLLSS
jgi:hypothetical protein